MSSGIRRSIVIIGGGIAGVSLSYYLASRGARDILVLEAEQLGSGCTGGSFGGVRQQFSTELEIKLSKRAIQFWRTVEERFDHPCPYYQDGYLFVSSRREVFAKLAEAAELQRRMGAGPVHMLDSDGIRKVTPWLGVDDLVGGCWTPEDGHVVPTDGLAALAAGARRLGVEFREGRRVSAIEKARRDDFVVRTSAENIDAEIVVVSAGYASPALLKPFGLDLPITPWPFHFALSEPALQGFTVPLVLDLDTGLFVEREGADALRLSLSIEGLPVDYGPTQMMYDFVALARTRAPSLLDVKVVKTASWAADSSGDGHPFVGQVEDGLWVLAGFAGHGTMHGPVVAELLAAQMTGGMVDLDISAFNPNRALAGVEEWMVGARSD